MKAFKEILICTIALTLIAGAVTAALAGTNALTADTIAARTQEAEDAARLQVIEADNFTPKTFKDETTEFTYYVAIKNGEEVGMVFTAVANGKSAGLTVMTGIDNNGIITGVLITEDNETAGYVDKVVKNGFLDNLKGAKAEEMTLGVDVDGVSQATKTSKGVLAAVNQAIRRFNQVGGGSSDGQ